MYWSLEHKVPVSRRCRAYEYLILSQAYIQSRMFLGAVYNIEHELPVYGKKIFVIEITEEKKSYTPRTRSHAPFSRTEIHPKQLPVDLQHLWQDVHKNGNRGLKLKK